MLIKIIHVVILIMFLSSCKDRCRKTIQVEIPNDIAKSYFYFNTGSYWIYSDTLGQINDTLIVSEYSIVYDRLGDRRFFFDKCYEYESVKCNIQNTKMSNNIIITASVTQDENFVVYYSNGDSNYIGSSIYFNKFDSSPHFSNNSNNILIDTLIVNNKEYYNILKLSITNNYDNNQNEYIYFAKDVGIIKIIKGSQIFNLLKKTIYN